MCRPVTKTADVTTEQYLTLGLCGAICTAIAHGVLTPLELVKTSVEIALYISVNVSMNEK